VIELFYTIDTPIAHPAVLKQQDRRFCCPIWL